MEKLIFHAQWHINLLVRNLSPFANPSDAYGLALENQAALSEISVGGGTQTGIQSFESEHGNSFSFLKRCTRKWTGQW